MNRKIKIFAGVLVAVFLIGILVYHFKDFGYFIGTKTKSVDVTVAENVVKSFVQNIIDSDPVLREHRVEIYSIKNVKTHPSLLEKYITFYVSYGGVEYYGESIFIVDKTSMAVQELTPEKLNQLLEKSNKKIKETDVLDCLEFYLMLKSIYSSEWYGIYGEPQIERVNNHYIVKVHVVSGKNVGGGYPLSPNDPILRKRKILLNIYSVDSKGKVSLVSSTLVSETTNETLLTFEISDYFVDRGDG